MQYTLYMAKFKCRTNTLLYLVILRVIVVYSMYSAWFEFAVYRVAGPLLPWGVYTPLLIFKFVHVHNVLFLSSFSSAHNQQVTNSIKEEVLVRHPNAKEEDIHGN